MYHFRPGMKKILSKHKNWNKKENAKKKKTKKEKKRKDERKKERKYISAQAANFGKVLSLPVIHNTHGYEAANTKQKQQKQKTVTRKQVKSLLITFSSLL